MWPLIWPGCCGRYSRQIEIACSSSPAFRYSFANGAKYRRGFSSNFFRNSSIRAELAIDYLKNGQQATGSEPGTEGRRSIHLSDLARQSEVTFSLDFSTRSLLTLQASFGRYVFDLHPSALR